MSMKVLGVITARGGSKGIPGKNTAVVAGRPLIAYTCDAARGSRWLDRCIVSTDDPSIAKVTRKYGIEAPFLRPAELARDDTPSIPVLLHAADWMAANAGYEADAILCLQPTSPLRTSADIDAAIRVMQEKGAEAVVSITAVDKHPLWMKTVDGSGRLQDYMGLTRRPTRRQDLPPLFSPNGAIFLARLSALRKSGWYGERTFGYQMPAMRSLDIDEPWQLAVAQALLERTE